MIQFQIRSKQIGRQTDRRQEKVLVENVIDSESSLRKNAFTHINSDVRCGNRSITHDDRSK